MLNNNRDLRAFYVKLKKVNLFKKILKIIQLGLVQKGFLLNSMLNKKFNSSQRNRIVFFRKKWNILEIRGQTQQNVKIYDFFISLKNNY